MKAEISPKMIGDRVYPYLGVYTDKNGEYIVLFSKRKTGMVVYSNHTSFAVGNYIEGLFREDEDFKPLEAGRRITLVN